MYQPPDPDSFNALVWKIVCQVPAGTVTTYGQIASMIPPPEGVEPPTYDRLSPRWVGTAMSRCPDDVPWQRVINSQGKISERPSAHRQRMLLEAEGISFSKTGHVDFNQAGWDGPLASWLDEHNLLPPRSLKSNSSNSSNSEQLSLF